MAYRIKLDGTTKDVFSVGLHNPDAGTPQIDLGAFTTGLTVTNVADPTGQTDLSIGTPDSSDTALRLGADGTESVLQYSGGALSFNAGDRTSGPGNLVIITGGTSGDDQGGSIALITGGGFGGPGTIQLTVNGTTEWVWQADGSVAIDGDEGTSGQVLTSNGPGSAPSWQTGGSGGDSTVPYFIPTGETFINNLYRQSLFAIDIDVEGTLEVNGILAEVD